MQRIIVKNFGPLKDIDLEIKDYMIFLGPQASGKSTLAKLIYGFKEVMWNAANNSWDLLWQLDNDRKNVLFGTDIIKWQTFFKVSLFNNLKNYKDFRIIYTYKEDFSITVFDKNGIISVAFSNGFYKKLLEIESKVKKEIEKLKSSIFEDEEYIKYFVTRIVSKETIIAFDANGIFFIPDKRDINNLQEVSYFSNYIKYNRDKFNEGFKSVENFLKNILESYDKKMLSISKELYIKVLKGEFENIDGGRISIDSNNKIPLDLASSGQKEVIGILIVLVIEAFISKKRFYVIEEPEAHLFPEAQKDITYLISLLANQEGNQVIITTHSHYILGALNILINANRIGQTNPEEVEKIVPRELWVDKNRIFAGFLENGIIKDIYDDEAEMIKIQQLNAVAGEINKDFDRLLDLEFANENV